MRAILMAGCLLAIAACDSGKTDPNASGNEPPRPFAVEGNEAAVRGAAGASRNAVSLLPDGLMITPGAEGGQVTILRFGETQQSVVAALSRDFGQPRFSENKECGAGPMQFADFGEIKANFSGGKFAGWLAEAGKGLKTGDGISPDMPFDEIEKFGAKRAVESTLEGEFDLTKAGGGSPMGGFADPDGKTRSLYAGTNCFFR